MYFFSLAIVCPRLNFNLLPRCPQVVWCHWGEMEPFPATLAQDGLAEWGQPGNNPSKYSVDGGNWTHTTGRTDSGLHLFSHWAIMTHSMYFHLLAYYSISMSALRDVLRQCSKLSGFHSVARYTRQTRIGEFFLKRFFPGWSYSVNPSWASVHGKKWLNRPSMAPHNLWTLSRKWNPRGWLKEW